MSKSVLFLMKLASKIISIFLFSSLFFQQSLSAKAIILFSSDIDYSTSTSFKSPQYSSDPSTCEVGQQYYNTTSNLLKVCTATDTWTALGTSNPDFESIYSTDVDKVLTASSAFSIDTSDWDISSTGNMTGFGAITMDGLLTGTAGATVSGAVISFNANSNFAVNIATGTSTGVVNLGNTTGGVSLGGGTVIRRHLSASSAIDIASTGARSCSSTTITVTGAATGDTVVATPTPVASGIETLDLIWNAYVSATNTVTIRACNPTNGSLNPASQTWRADVWQH